MTSRWIISKGEGVINTGTNLSMILEGFWHLYIVLFVGWHDSDCDSKNRVNLSWAVSNIWRKSNQNHKLVQVKNSPKQYVTNKQSGKAKWWNDMMFFNEILSKMVYRSFNTALLLKIFCNEESMERVCSHEKISLFSLRKIFLSLLSVSTVASSLSITLLPTISVSKSYLSLEWTSRKDGREVTAPWKYPTQVSLVWWC